MKKLVVLALLLTAGMLWAQAAAPVVPWSDVHKMDLGLTLDYGFANDFGPGKEFADYEYLELKFNWVVDDFTTAYVELEEGPITGAGSTTGAFAATTGNARNAPSQGRSMAIAGVDRAWFMTDLGKAFKLPVGVVAVYGLNEWNNKDWLTVTKGEFENFVGEKDIRRWGAQLEIMPSPMVTLRSQWSWNFKDQLFLVGAYGAVGPISYEATYYTNGEYLAATDNGVAGADRADLIAEEAADLNKIKGWVEGGVKFAQDLTKDLNVAAVVGFQYDMADYSDAWLLDYKASTATNTAGDNGIEFSQYYLQAGAHVMFQKMASLGLAWRGAEQFMAGAFRVEGWAMPIKGQPLELLAVLGLGLDSDLYDNMFDSLEVSFRYTLGKVQWYLGVLYNSDLGRVIAKEWADFDLAARELANLAPFSSSGVRTGEMTAIFLRGRLNI